MELKSDVPLLMYNKYLLRMSSMYRDTHLLAIYYHC